MEPSEEESRPFIRKALETGINFFDTANRYSLGNSEEILGRAIKDFGRREEVVIATKVYGRMRPGPNGAGLSRKAIFAEIDNSLRRLGMDYVDLYQIHRFDHETPIEETLEALHDLVKAGKVRYIGASSMHAWEFARALGISEKRGWTRFVSMQNLVNLLYREEEREMLPLCEAESIGVIPWSPQARGKLSRDWDYTSIRTETDDAMTRLFAKTQEADKKVVDRVAEVAKARGIPAPRSRWRGSCRSRPSPRRSSGRPNCIISTTRSRRWTCGCPRMRLPRSKHRTFRTRSSASSRLQ